MLRFLFEIGPIRVHTYGFMLMLAFALGILLAVRRASRRGIATEHIMDLSTGIVLAAVVGSRVLYVLAHLESYRPPLGRWWDVFKVYEGGLTLYGGVVAAVVLGVWFCRRRGLRFLRVADIVAPSLALGVAITRIGCFLNGCCFGRECHLPWAVQFPEGSLAYAAHGWQAIPVHPSQLYASAVGFAVFVVLLRVDRKPRAEGLLLWLFAFLFGSATLVTDFSRYWETSATILSFDSALLSLNQLLELGLAVVGLVGLGRIRRRGGKEGRAAEET